MVNAVYCCDSGTILTCQNLLLNPLKRNEPCQPYSPELLGFLGVDMNLSLSVHLGDGSHHRNAMSHISFSLEPPHCTTVIGWGISPLPLACPLAKHALLPGVEVVCAKTTLEGLTVIYTDLVLNCTCANLFIAIQCKSIMIYQHKFPSGSSLSGGPIP